MELNNLIQRNVKFDVNLVYYLLSAYVNMDEFILKLYPHGDEVIYIWYNIYGN